MARGDIDVVVGPGAQLGEGPVWDARVQRLLWVDIYRRLVHLTETTTGDTESFTVPEDIGAVVPRHEGGFIAALRNGFWQLDGGNAAHVIHVGTEDGVRFNDGKCDPQGRFWAGTIVEDGQRPGAALYCLDADLGLSMRVPGVSVSNGLSWSLEGDAMFYIDTPTNRVDRFRFDAATGEISGREAYIDIPVDSGHPDGMTIDADGGLWVALWDGGAIHRYVDGRLERVVSMPVSRPTSCTFGGPGYQDLYVTSAAIGLTEAELAEQPLAGALFKVTTDVHGLAPSYFGAA